VIITYWKGIVLMTPVENNHMIKGISNSSYVHKNHMSRDHANPYNKTLKQSDNMVNYLAQKLGSLETHQPFYRHVSWKMHDNTIRRLVGAVQDKNPTSPLAYFITCVKREKEYYTNS
jgi:hypothetical protein